MNTDILKRKYNVYITHAVLAWSMSGDSEPLLSDVSVVDKRRVECREWMSEYNAFVSDEENRGLVRWWEWWARFTSPEDRHAKHCRDVVLVEYIEHVSKHPDVKAKYRAVAEKHNEGILCERPEQTTIS
jgi:hypothetical protein